MSTYKPHMPMPLDMLEYQQKIKEFSGLHMSFPYGTILPKEGASKFETPIPEEMHFDGLTIRGFFYIPESSDITSHFDLYCENKKTQYWNVSLAEVYIEKTYVKFRTIKANELKPQWEHDYTTYTVPVPGYYSVAVRFVEGDHLQIFFGDNKINSLYQGAYKGREWLFRMWGRVHFLVSLHFSAELDQMPGKVGHQFYVKYPECGIGSYWLVEGVITGTNKPLTVKLPGGEANVPLRTVKQQDVVTIHIRSTRGGYLVSTSFDDETKFITTAENSKNFIYPEFSDNFQIYRQFAEQGAERYQ